MCCSVNINIIFPRVAGCWLSIPAAQMMDYLSTPSASPQPAHAHSHSESRAHFCEFPCRLRKSYLAEEILSSLMNAQFLSIKFQLCIHIHTALHNTVKKISSLLCSSNYVI
jgi:hypothetical protein